jgi:hypothetical protein
VKPKSLQIFPCRQRQCAEKEKEKEEKSAYLNQSEDELRMMYGTKINIVPIGYAGI